MMIAIGLTQLYKHVPYNYMCMDKNSFATMSAGYDDFVFVFFSSLYPDSQMDYENIPLQITTQTVWSQI